MGKVRIAIVGVGNCASSLVQGLEYYKDADGGARDCASSCSSAIRPAASSSCRQGYSDPYERARNAPSTV